MWIEESGVACENGPQHRIFFVILLAIPSDVATLPDDDSGDVSTDSDGILPSDVGNDVCTSDDCLSPGPC